MPRISDNIPINDPELDRRVKLTELQKHEIRMKYNDAQQLKIKGLLHKSVSQRSLAKEYGVSRRLIQWILQPEKLKTYQERKSKCHYSQWYYQAHVRGKKWRETMRNHRAYKKELYIQGLIGKAPLEDIEK